MLGIGEVVYVSDSYRDVLGVVCGDGNWVIDCLCCCDVIIEERWYVKVY